MPMDNSETMPSFLYCAAMTSSPNWTMMVASAYC